MPFQGPPESGEWLNKNIDKLLIDDKLVTSLGDWNRNNTLMAVDDIAVRFIFHHEFSHVIYGHTRWLKANFGVTEMDELRSFTNEISPLDKQVLEYHADTTAVHRIMNQMLRISNRIPGQICRTGPLSYNDYGTKEQANFAFAIAIYILFRTMDLMANEAGLDIDIYHRDHPPAWCRLQYCLTMFDEAFCREFNAPSDIVVPIIVQGLRVVEKRWMQAIGGEPIIEKLFSKDSLDAGDVYFSQIRDRFQAVEAKLQGYIRGPIPFIHLMI